MALGTTHTDWQHGFYEADSNDQIKKSDNSCVVDWNKEQGK